MSSSISTRGTAEGHFMPSNPGGWAQNHVNATASEAMSEILVSMYDGKKKAWN